MNQPKTFGKDLCSCGQHLIVQFKLYSMHLSIRSAVLRACTFGSENNFPSFCQCLRSGPLPCRALPEGSIFPIPFSTRRTVFHRTRTRNRGHSLDKPSTQTQWWNGKFNRTAAKPPLSSSQVAQSGVASSTVCRVQSFSKRGCARGGSVTFFICSFARKAQWMMWGKRGREGGEGRGFIRKKKRLSGLCNGGGPWGERRVSSSYVIRRVFCGPAFPGLVGSCC